MEVEAKGFRVDLSHAEFQKSSRSGPNCDNCVEGVADPGIGHFISRPPPFRDCHHQSAAAQTGEVVRHGLPGYPRQVGEVRRVGRTVP